MEEQRFCKGCQQWKPLVFFRRNREIRLQLKSKEYKRVLCKDCEFKKRQLVKIETKAAKAIYNHAKKLRITSEAFQAGGVTTEYVAFLFQRELNLIKAFGIEYCANCYPNRDQLREPCYSKNTTPFDLHLDIIDIERFKRMGILTRSNVRVICRTANVSKGRKDSTAYDIEVLHYGQDEASIAKGVQFSLQEKIPPQIKINTGQLRFL